MLCGSTLAAVVLAIVITVLVTLINRRKLQAPYPPGPKGLPFIGNALQLPKEHEWLTYTSWGEQYGANVVTLNMIPSLTIVGKVTSSMSPSSVSRWSS